MADQQEDVVGGVDLDGEEYVVRQHLVRNKYRVYDADGELLLRAKQKLFRVKEEFPFTDADGEPVFRVKAEGVLDVAGDYVLTDEASGDSIAVLDKSFTLLKHVWTVRGPDGDRELARIESGSAFVEFLRGVSSVFNLVPHTYTVESPDGERLGQIRGRLALRDVYDLELRETGDAPREALVVACIAIDALEGN